MPPSTEKVIATPEEMQAMVDMITELVRERNHLKRVIATLRETGRRVVQLGLDAADVIASENIVDPEEIEDERDRLNRLGRVFAKGRRHR